MDIIEPEGFNIVLKKLEEHNMLTHTYDTKSRVLRILHNTKCIYYRHMTTQDRFPSTIIRIRDLIKEYE